MQRERVTDDIYVFTSERYAQVTAGLVVSESGAVLIGTLVYPEETLQIKRFVEERLDQPVRYVINTHYHADHTAGTCFFDDAEIIGHDLCRDLLDGPGRVSLNESRANSPEMAQLSLVLPDRTFSDRLTLYLGNKTLHLAHMPGHTPDSIIVLVKEDQVLFAADTVMPVPYFADGDYDTLLNSLSNLDTSAYEHIVQGYGEVVLRGEVKEKIQSDIDYLVKLGEAVDRVLAQSPEDNLTLEAALQAIDIEDCGKSRILLNGMVEQIHRRNVLWLAQQRRQPQPEAS